MSKRLQITIKDDVNESLEKMAKEMGVSKSVVITLALQNYERKHKERIGQ